MTFTAPNPDDLALYLNDSGIKLERIQTFIDDAIALCLSVVSPLPDGAEVVVKRAAGRGYTTTMSTARQEQLAAAGSPFPPGMGGVWLTRADRADLRRLAGGGGAFSIDLLPIGYTVPCDPPWDTGLVPGDVNNEGFGS